MLHIGLIREGKIPADTRVALTPAQCRWLHKNFEDVRVTVQPCSNRCYSDAEYQQAGIPVQEDLSACNLLMGIKEVPKQMLIPGKTYIFFSHTKKLQPHNQQLFQTLMQNRNTLVDYECLEHRDGTRIIGFGFFAGVVGAHNGIMAYGHRTGAFSLPRVGTVNSFQKLIHTYFGLKLPNIKIAVTGSGRVAHGVLEVMNLLGIHEVEPEEYLEYDQFDYPVYVHLKGSDLYVHQETGKYNREQFHTHPEIYRCLFPQYLPQTDILINGVYWEQKIPRLFELDDIQRPDFRIVTLADITDDAHGSVPCNLGDSTIADPVYGVDKQTFQQTEPYLSTSVDVMAVGNLPNELPRDASRYFGEQLIKYVLEDFRQGGSEVLSKATLIRNGELNSADYGYMREYAGV